ncbi:MAG: DUF4282 domain-containing protein [Terricaulis sp.]
MNSIVGRFLGFDRLIGTVLVKIVYYVGAFGIAAAVVGGLLAALLSLFAGNFGGAIMQFIAWPAVGAVGLVYWRFICELFMLAFLAYDRLGEIKTLLGGATGQPDPNHPQF